MEIKELRDKLNISRETLGRMLGVSHMTVYRWEIGKSEPSPLAKREIERLLAEIKKDESGSPSKMFLLLKETLKRK